MIEDPSIVYEKTRRWKEPLWKRS